MDRCHVVSRGEQEGVAGERAGGDEERYVGLVVEFGHTDELLYVTTGDGRGGCACFASHDYAASVGGVGHDVGAGVAMAAAVV